LAFAAALAEDPPAPAPEPVPAPTAPAPEPIEREGEARKVRVKTPPKLTEPDRAGSVITRRELDERLPRSAPDALRGEPGVFVQQTAHGQASPYIRGLTGQQTVMLFDGIRMNTSTFRQGPNQYFFTVDSRTIDHLEVVRGGSSTRYGADSIGGAILATPLAPSMDRGKGPVTAHGRAIVHTATADAQLGGRAQLDLGVLGKVGILGGFGYRDLNQLYSGGRFRQPADGELQKIPPRYGPDGKTQLGTGFREYTGDVRAVGQINRRNRVTVAYYDYRQRDAPRTDFCPPPTAPEDGCLTYKKQYRTLVYGKYEHEHGPAAAEKVALTMSYQRQYEDRYLDIGDDSSTRRTGRDTVHTIGTALTFKTKQFAPAPWSRIGVTYGADAYFDRVRSDATLTFIDLDPPVSTPDISQYTDRAKYFTGGVWGIAEAWFTSYMRIRAGARFAAVRGRAPYSATRDSQAFRLYWLTGVGHFGITFRPLEWLSFPFSVDQGFRAPNIDDLTSRQATGGGQQFENARLKPEHSTLFEGGILIERKWIELKAFAFYTVIGDHIQRRPATSDECPEGDTVCGGARFRMTLDNLPSLSVLRGVDGGIKIYLPYDFGAAATFSYAWGEGHNPRWGVVPDESFRVPLSRVPPINGTGEFGWRSTEWGPYIIGVVRWARLQDRLNPVDENDVRIPAGGTPGWVVGDIRAGYRLDPHLVFGMVFENVASSPYRYHGSSVNAPGRGLILELQGAF
jgi:iron complex outermembrane receptor protein/hemoglobin/transferrin/lactoferrin receptor protein